MSKVNVSIYISFGLDIFCTSCNISLGLFKRTILSNLKTYPLVASLTVQKMSALLRSFASRNLRAFTQQSRNLCITHRTIGRITVPAKCLNGFGLQNINATR